MTKQLIKLTPLSPYFFGGEHIFEKGDKNKHYYIRSLEVPSQTTLFGVLRYMAIKNPGSIRDWNKRYNERRNNSGDTSEFRGYALNRPDISFGNIAGISPLYLVDDKKCFYAPLPFDHKKGNSIYTPFSDYKEVDTTSGKRNLPLDYEPKDGVAMGWLALDGSNRIENDLFKPVTQIGINRILDKHAFYKKEYIRLEKGYSFAFVADINMDLYNNLVNIGQDKTPFHAEWNPIDEEPGFPRDILRSKMAYAQSDIYIKDNLSALYNSCSFVCVKSRTHRLFKESYLDRHGSTTTKLISAGSVFVPNNIKEFLEMTENTHASLAGFNRIIIGGEK